MTHTHKIYNNNKEIDHSVLKTNLHLILFLACLFLQSHYSSIPIRPKTINESHYKKLM